MLNKMPKRRSGCLYKFRFSFGNVLKANLIKGYTWLRCIIQTLQTIIVLGPDKCFVSNKKYPTAKLNIFLFKIVGKTPLKKKKRKIPEM